MKFHPHTAVVLFARLIRLNSCHILFPENGTILMCLWFTNRGGATLKAGGSNEPLDLEKRKFLYIILKKKINPYNKNLHTLTLSLAEFSF